MEKLTNKKSFSLTLSSSNQKISAVILTILTLQFLLGTYTNLYISIPSNSHSGTSFGMGTMMGSMGNYGPIFMFHMMLGPILVIVSLIAFMLALVSKNKNEVIFSSIGLLSIIIAGFAGLVFFMGGGHNSYSFLMALGFIAAFSAYFANLVWGERTINS